jgi:long-subunit fatty acid transport protein
LEGNFGLAIGSYTIINISPQVGYRFTQALAAGMGVNLIYVSEKQRDLSGNPVQKITQELQD